MSTAPTPAALTSLRCSSHCSVHARTSCARFWALVSKTGALDHSISSRCGSCAKLDACASAANIAAERTQRGRSCAEDGGGVSGRSSALEGRSAAVRTHPSSVHPGDAAHGHGTASTAGAAGAAVPTKTVARRNTMRKPKRGTSSRETRRGNGVAASRWEPNPPPEPLARAAPGAACRVSRGCVPGADEFVGPRLRFSLTKLITSLPCRAARAGVGVGAPRSRPVRSHGCRRGHFPAVPSARVATSRPHACPGSGSSGCAAVADAVFLAGAWQMFGILAVFSKLNEFQSVLPPRPPCDSDDVWAGAHIGSRRAGAAQLLPRLPPSACDSRGSAQRPVHAACACACLADRGAVRGSTAAPADPSRTRPKP